MTRREESFWNRVLVGDGCWEWTGGTVQFGYGKLMINGKRHAAHRISWQMKYGPISNDICVLHRCDNPACVRPSHLFLGTKADNAQDCARKGRMNHIRGVRHPWSKLTEDQVREIRNSTGPLRDAATKYGVSRSAISLIRRGDNWAHLS
jgi:hypothetical protein